MAFGCMFRSRSTPSGVVAIVAPQPWLGWLTCVLGLRFAWTSRGSLWRQSQEFLVPWRHHTMARDVLWRWRQHFVLLSRHRGEEWILRHHLGNLEALWVQHGTVHAQARWNSFVHRMEVWRWRWRCYPLWYAGFAPLFLWICTHHRQGRGPYTSQGSTKGSHFSKLSKPQFSLDLFCWVIFFIFCREYVHGKS